MLKNTPLISIIIPLYNKRPYVERAIQSILEQTIQQWELIVVDDGSTDDSAGIVLKIKDPRIRLYRQENKGPAAARNYGIRMASGDFITFLDADDYYYPNKLEREMEILKKEKVADWMISAFDYEQGKKIEYRPIKTSMGKEIQGTATLVSDAIKELKVSGWHINGLCIKKTLVERVGGFNEKMQCYEVSEFIIRCALIQPELIANPEPLFCVIDTPDSAFKISQHRIEGERQKGEIFYRLSRDYPGYSKQLISKSYKSLLTYAALLVLSGKKSEARRYLLTEFPLPRTRRWWKIIIGSFMPDLIIQNVISVR